MEISIFTKYLGRRIFNPYMSIGKFELAIDKDGFLICWGKKYVNHYWKRK